MAKELGPTTDFQISPPTPGWSQVESRPMGHSSPRQWVGNASTHWVTCIMYSFGRPIAIPNRSENESHSGTQQTRRMQQLFSVCWWLSRSAFCFLVGANPQLFESFFGDKFASSAALAVLLCTYVLPYPSLHFRGIWPYCLRTGPPACQLTVHTARISASGWPPPGWMVRAFIVLATE